MDQVGITRGDPQPGAGDRGVGMIRRRSIRRASEAPARTPARPSKPSRTASRPTRSAARARSSADQGRRQRAVEITVVLQEVRGAGRQHSVSVRLADRAAGRAADRRTAGDSETKLRSASREIRNTFPSAGPSSSISAQSSRSSTTSSWSAQNRSSTDDSIRNCRCGGVEFGPAPLRRDSPRHSRCRPESTSDVGTVPQRHAASTTPAAQPSHLSSTALAAPRVGHPLTASNTAAASSADSLNAPVPISTTLFSSRRLARSSGGGRRPTSTMVVVAARVDQCTAAFRGRRMPTPRRVSSSTTTSGPRRSSALDQRGHQLAERSPARPAEVAQHACDRPNDGSRRRGRDVQQQVRRIVVEVIHPQPRERALVGFVPEPNGRRLAVAGRCGDDDQCRHGRLSNGWTSAGRRRRRRDPRTPDGRRRNTRLPIPRDHGASYPRRLPSQPFCRWALGTME